ncbi:hypothetical protein JZ751_001924 [Albula glossodonta]|uniref:Uncharacterized protein n=1 Tax=Albula glossodonta TaxID=121402 RepID=A0A8T2P7G7_9TELE|nr:hypothetical protein JZ751_001924 [Albula glossodonta]
MLSEEGEKTPKTDSVSPCLVLATPPLPAVHPAACWGCCVELCWDRVLSTCPGLSWEGACSEITLLKWFFPVCFLMKDEVVSSLSTLRREWRCSCSAAPSAVFVDVFDPSVVVGGDKVKCRLVG